jgi:hypothetical protein
VCHRRLDRHGQHIAELEQPTNEHKSTGKSAASEPTKFAQHSVLLGSPLHPNFASKLPGYLTSVLLGALHGCGCSFDAPWLLHVCGAVCGLPQDGRRVCKGSCGILQQCGYVALAAATCHVPVLLRICGCGPFAPEVPLANVA